MSPERCDPCVWIRQEPSGEMSSSAAPSQQQAACFVFCCYIATDAMFNFSILFHLLIILTKSLLSLKIPVS